ncbi:Dual specificity catalytic domain-containing protein [Mycena sanguinolenta]|uniref:Dual specificity catalytic domain-containing protein n=1 Tax=Mycena sanguinolenta TaxID=230812 RepID=A0A8H6XFP6_9AGAR|nr:Dual specificity catalytic domain-containing protein [Mycena sanguinolenta]
MPPRKRGPPSSLRIDAPVQPHPSRTIPPFHQPSKPRSLQNMKKLSLNLSSAQSSTTSLLSLGHQSAASPIQQEPLRMERPRRPSVISLPPPSANPIPSTRLTRKGEDGSPAVPYVDGPIQIIPGIWLGSEDNVKDWTGLLERGIKSVLNVAKEVVSPFDSAAASQARRGFSSTPNLNSIPKDSTYYPADLARGRPGMYYLKLQWSHGQQDLVEHGFPDAMAFTDAALERGDGVLIQSATLVIALVMRAAAERSPNVPSEIWALRGMQGAYTFVKEKSKWVGPNMSLIYQLLEYEKRLRGDSGDKSETDSVAADEDEEWGRQRRMLDEVPTDDEEDERESSLMMREAQYLDKAMEDRMLARKTSSSSIASSSSGVGMGAAWRSRYGSRKRAGSIASNMTNGSSIISEDLVEEEEEQELLGIGGGFDDERGSSAEPEYSSTSSPDDDVHSGTTPRHPIRPPPSAPVWKTSFTMTMPPATAFRPTFDLPPLPTKSKRRPTPLGILPPVPPSPIKIIVNDQETPQKRAPRKPLISLPPRVRTESRKPPPPALHLRSNLLKPKTPQNPPSGLATPSQTLFVFPPSPTLTTRTPSAMTLTSNLNTAVPFPSSSTPRVSTFRSQGRTRSFIGLGAPPTPTTAFSKVDARGFFGLE